MSKAEHDWTPDTRKILILGFAEDDMRSDPPPEESPEIDSEDPKEGFDASGTIQLATDQNRSNLIADIVGHPTGMISVEELDYMNPDMSSDAIRRHLHELMGVGVVDEHSFEPGDRMREFPYKFYTISANARQLFDRNELFPVEAWRRQYRSVRKTARIRQLEAMPRPG